MIHPFLYFMIIVFGIRIHEICVSQSESQSQKYSTHQVESVVCSLCIRRKKNKNKLTSLCTVHNFHICYVIKTVFLSTYGEDFLIYSRDNTVTRQTRQSFALEQSVPRTKQTNKRTNERKAIGHRRWLHFVARKIVIFGTKIERRRYVGTIECGSHTVWTASVQRLNRSSTPCPINTR